MYTGVTEKPYETLDVMTAVHLSEQPGEGKPPDVNPHSVLAEKRPKHKWKLEHIYSENKDKVALLEFSLLTAAYRIRPRCPVLYILYTLYIIIIIMYNVYNI